MKKLTEYLKGDLVRILQINIADKSESVLQNMGVYSNEIVEIKRNSKLGGPVIIQKDNTEIALGYSVANKIQAEKV